MVKLHTDTSCRLLSIVEDATYVGTIAESYPTLPLVANERCGRWYVPPGKQAVSAYFKSTDGHCGQYAFSKRRLNLHLLDVIGRNGGCVIIDTSRRKLLPDSLSKTIPIWCCVINRLLFPDIRLGPRLQCPTESVHYNEYEIIDLEIDRFVQDAKALDLDLFELREQLKKPIRVWWTSPNLNPDPIALVPDVFNTIICCSASKHLSLAAADELGYVQGGADDSENWAPGLTPSIFWTHQEALLTTAKQQDSRLLTVIEEYVKRERKAHPGNYHGPVWIRHTPIWIGIIGRDDVEILNTAFDRIILCGDNGQNGHGWDRKKTRSLDFSSGKLASRELRQRLPYTFKKLEDLPQWNGTSYVNGETRPRILVMCSTGKDISVGVALALCCHLSTENNIDKAAIKRHLAHITMSKPDASPSRATLNSVHAVLMPEPEDARGKRGSSEVY